MKVIVIGAGVIGVTSAYFMARAGHTVTLLEEREGVALGTSFANAGQLSYGYAMPWASPGMISKALKWSLQENAPFKLSLDGEYFADQLNWLMKMALNCKSETYELNKQQMLKISNLSKKVLNDLLKTESIDFNHQQKGTLQLFRTNAQLEHAVKKESVMLRESGVACEVLSVEQALEKEPGLALNADKLKGALWLPGDETGDCHLFTTALLRKCLELGVELKTGKTVSALMLDDGKALSGIKAGSEYYFADAYVFCTGSSFLKFKEEFPSYDVYPVKGFSATFEAGDYAPLSTVMDETNKIAMTRLGNRVRLGGTAAVSGFDYSLPGSKKEFFKKTYAELFEETGEDFQFWTGLRPSTPSGVPYIEKLKTKNGSLRNGWINCGHGTLGWTMAAGSAAILSELLNGSN